MPKQKQGKKADIPQPKKAEGPKRKACKSPRGQKLSKTKDILVHAVEKPIKRHRNQYNQQMAKVRRLANLIQRVG